MGILLKDVCYRYQGKYQTVQAVNGISYDFESGKLYALSLIHISEPTRH